MRREESQHERSREDGEHILVLLLLILVVAFAVLLVLALPQALELAAGHVNAATDWMGPEQQHAQDPEALRMERQIEWWL